MSVDPRQISTKEQCHCDLHIEEVALVQRARRRRSAGGGYKRSRSYGCQSDGGKGGSASQDTRKPKAATASSPEHHAGSGGKIKLGRREGAREDGIGPEVTQSRHGERLNGVEREPEKSPATAIGGRRRRSSSAGGGVELAQCDRAQGTEQSGVGKGGEDHGRAPATWTAGARGLEIGLEERESRERE